MTTEKLDQLADAVFISVRSFVAKAIGGFEPRLAALEQRVSAIPAGEKGERGEQGKDGLPGRDGKDGKDGRDGKDGAPGERGERGEAGINGKDGAPGERGERGEAGINGKDGAPGERGQPGESGRPGADGSNGKDGAQGERGERGEAGANGRDGTDGANGRDGIDGKDGAAGRDGLSAYELAKVRGFGGSEIDWLMSLRGKDGIDGQNGRDGMDGKDGRDGQRGEAGRDALELDVLDGIDLGRAYPRGTFAAFNGGLFRASRATDPLADGARPTTAGWACVLRGIADTIETLEDGGRFIARETRYSDGSIGCARLQTAMQINRGVYQRGKVYEAGDIVTANGSQFVATERTSDAPPGGAWKLVVKHGRDGKDAA